MGEAPTALGAGGREQKQRPAFPHAADLSSIRPERLNRLAIPIISVRHICSFLKKLMPTRSAFLLRARRVLCHSIPSQHMTSSHLHRYPSANLHKSNGPVSPGSGSRMGRLSTSALPAQGSVSCHAILTDDQGAVSWSMDTGVVGLTSWLRVVSALSIAGGSLEVTRFQVVFHFHFSFLLCHRGEERLCRQR